MTSRISQKLSELKSAGRKAFAAYVVAGDPSADATVDIVLELEKAGATHIELGVPFSDPMADGPVIQRASERALAKGVTLKTVLDIVRRVRVHSQVPILLMGYYNPVLQYGLARFAADAVHAGVDGALIVDLPVEEAAPLEAEFKTRGLDLIFLVTPVSDQKRVRLIGQHGSGFIYYVSLTGITGAASLSVTDVRKNVAKLRRQIDLPILVGFGISTPEQVQAVADSADGVVVGTAILKIIEDAAPTEVTNKAGAFVRGLLSAN